MKLFKTVIIIFISFMMFGCESAFTTIVKINDNIINKVDVYTDKKILNQKNVRTIRVIEATSCQYLIFESKASENNCINQLKTIAYNLGANAIIIMEFKKSGVSIDADCWSTVKGKAIAIIVKKEK